MAEEDYTVKKYKRVLFYSVMLAMFLAYIVGQYIYPSERDVEYDFENIVYSGEFYWEKTDGSEEKISVPGSYDVQAGDTMIRKRQDRLAKILRAATCSVRHHQKMQERKCGLNSAPIQPSIPVL